MHPLFNSFHDELTKIAGLPAAVRKGGGGALGALMRKSNQLGRSAASRNAAAAALPGNVGWRAGSGRLSGKQALVDSANAFAGKGMKVKRTLKANTAIARDMPNTARGKMIRNNPSYRVPIL